MKEILLTRKLVALVDDCDFEHLTKWKWHAAAGGRYAGRMSNRKLVYMHREIAIAGCGDVVDHVDGNTLNNTRANLRLCTNANNQMNRAPSHGKTSVFKGVYRSPRKLAKPWMAYIHGDGKRQFLGWHATEREAATAYNYWAERYFGEYARLNVIEESA